MHPEFLSLATEALRCRSCFDTRLVEPATIDLAQPRWIGPGYWSSKPRIALVLINPGAGAKYAKGRNVGGQETLHKALDDPSNLISYLEDQRENLPRWGRGRFWRFFMEKAGLNPDAIALANIAWCASRNNHYPRAMLSNCFEQFTHRLLTFLRPDIVLLCGSAAHRFHDQIQTQLPQAKIIETLHYSHRKGFAAEAAAVNEIKPALRNM